LNVIVKTELEGTVMFEECAFIAVTTADLA